jgi:ABC-type oligopeptide transport system substrate-binding subunit
VSHTFFSPLPQKAVEKGHMEDWGKTAMVGNGPFTMAEPANEQQVVIVRNDKWAGNVYGDKRANLDKIIFKVEKDVQGGYTDFEAGTAMSASVPPGKSADALKKYHNTLTQSQLATYYFDFGFKNNPQLSDENGKDNSDLRKAISMAIDREQINAKVYEGVRILPTGITPPGVPGFKKDICKYCTYDLDGAKAMMKKWTDAGGKLDGPITIDFNTGAGHEDVVSIVQDNLKTIGVDSKTNPVSEKYFTTMGKGGCHFCRDGWIADYPTYGNFSLDLFSTTAVGGNNHANFSDPKYDDLIAKAQAEVDPDKRASFYQQAEDYLLNDRMAVTPINWYVGDQVSADNVVNYEQPPLSLILWERVGLKK